MGNTHTTSTQGRLFIEKEEGTVLHLYQDQVGKWTIGTGHLVRPGEDFTNGISPEQADALLAEDLRLSESCVNSIVMGDIGQNMFDACVSLTFNIGVGAFVLSSVAKLINAGDYLAAADAFRLWNKATVDGKLVVLPVLVGRRERERAVFLRDVSTLPTDAA